MTDHAARTSNFVSLKMLAIVGFISLAAPSQLPGQTASTIWPATTTPAVADDGPDNAVEVGVKFRSDVSGSITAIRFYKASTNTGSHVASLWSSTGTLLGRATFNSETASGWQQVSLPSPVSIRANAVYVASYHTNVGHYADDQNYFASKGVDNAPLHALQNGVSGVNGVYAYSSSSKFPNQGWQQSNYWVDVVFTSGPADTTPPMITGFTVPSTATTLTVPITTFTATDNVAVTGYMLNESSNSPSPSATGWLGAPPTSYTFATAGAKVLYAWAKDAAGNVSTSLNAPVIITLPVDATPPTVTAFSIPATATGLTVSITTFTATDNMAVTGYVATESSTAPPATATGWSSAPPTSYTFASAGAKTLYAWAKDAAGNVSASRSASVTITLDTTAPTVTAFSIPATATSLTVPITTFAATDNVAVTGYMATESSTAPSATAAGWSSSAPASYTFTSAGAKTLYAWAKDAAGNRSTSRSASVTITLSSTSPEPTGWFAGDIHVHRSCGSSPEAVSSIFNKMSTNNLAFVSLLADMGNGEVQNPTTDLPMVGKDDPVSTAQRILHWDAEWHWDATYTQYPHQALGGHLVVLGVSSAKQIWDELTSTIINWAHQLGGLAGFAHMQYLDNNIPSGLSCCTPIEYPVEVGLGSADFISEDVDALNDGTSGMDTNAAIRAYYRLLNNGFRPGLAAGTDYPCNGGQALGSLLTYAQPSGGQMTYQAWIKAIKNGRTVISRNAHNEYLNLVVNGTATPGDQINLSSAAGVQVTVQWTASKSYSGTVELLQNGVVVASQTGSVSSGQPVTLTATVNFPASGWLAARRMTSSGEYAAHTAAVFVVVNNAPIRQSASDAQFYIDWMNTLLTNTSRGGVWNSFFPTELTTAQARYNSAKSVYQQILSETASGTSSGPSIFTTQIPTLFENEAAYELGTKFYSDVSGTITQVRLYTAASESGAHTVRIWRVSDGALLAGPFTWTITAGTEGWKTFALPSALSIAANTDYIIDISNGSDHYYAEEPNGFAAAIVNGHLHTYVGSGIYSTALGTMPTSTWQNTNYFRDIVFVPAN